MSNIEGDCSCAGLAHQKFVRIRTDQITALSRPIPNVICPFPRSTLLAIYNLCEYQTTNTQVMVPCHQERENGDLALREHHFNVGNKDFIQRVLDFQASNVLSTVPWPKLSRTLLKSDPHHQFLACFRSFKIFVDVHSVYDFSLVDYRIIRQIREIEKGSIESCLSNRDDPAREQRVRAIIEAIDLALGSSSSHAARDTTERMQDKRGRFDGTELEPVQRNDVLQLLHAKKTVDQTLSHHRLTYLLVSSVSIIFASLGYHATFFRCVDFVDSLTTLPKRNSLLPKYLSIGRQVILE
ncbi:hypothetical protein BDV96DRAFT_604879 [Lophiotrema nucula]|uniref:Uncharacterized protein n=1 Tax=Lophiotrema nucula TaxID=690887 RepID=A0A6A5YQZ4_9PLEO|nr:hypothetical protein BDV96DRAFT_604879 [Lophiotrema nucula]